MFVRECNIQGKVGQKTCKIKPELKIKMKKIKSPKERKAIIPFEQLEQLCSQSC